MSDRVYVATHKGLFTLERSGGEWQMAGVEFLGNTVTMVLHDPRDGTSYAALDHGHFGVKLHRSDDHGRTWPEVAVPVYPASGDEQDGPSLKEIWSLEISGPDEPGRLWAGTIPGGLFRSDDRGESWELIESLWERPERSDWFGGGKDEAGIHSICVDPRDSRRVTVGVSCGGVWTTADGGDSWEIHASDMHANYMPPERQADPSIQDVHRLVQCRDLPEALWVQHHNAIYRSTDAAASWTSIDPAAVTSVFGFTVAVHPADPDTAWFVPGINDDCRVPVDARFVVTRTRDGGASFEAIDRGLPPAPAYDLVYRHGLDVDEQGERLVMGSTTGGLWISEDGGDTWPEVAGNLPPVNCVRFAAEPTGSR